MREGGTKALACKELFRLNSSDWMRNNPGDGRLASYKPELVEEFQGF